MRLVDGTDLKKVLGEGPLEPARAVRIAEQTAAALDAAHARGLVHRDVKPSNLLLDQDEHVYLADFGLTRTLGEAAAPLDAGRSLGTSDYVAPEQIRGDQIDGRADQYSLACVLYECLTGTPPFRRGTEVATLYAHLEEAPPAPPGLEDVLAQALAKDPAERYPTCVELVAAARSALGLEPNAHAGPMPLPPPASFCSRPRCSPTSSHAAAQADRPPPAGSSGSIRRRTASRAPSESATALPRSLSTRAASGSPTTTTEPSGGSIPPARPLR